MPIDPGDFDYVLKIAATAMVKLNELEDGLEGLPNGHAKTLSYRRTLLETIRLVEGLTVEVERLKNMLY
jgi:hypothetical protein